MAIKVKDLAVKTGTYTDSQGNEKGRWQNVGAIMENADGGQFIMLARWFNPAGVPDLSGKNSESILLSAFDPRDRGQDDRSQPQAQRQQPALTKPQPGQHSDFDDDMPF